jgi:hypothetical protein
VNDVLVYPYNTFDFNLQVQEHFVPGVLITIGFLGGGGGGGPGLGFDVVVPAI